MHNTEFLRALAQFEKGMSLSRPDDERMAVAEAFYHYLIYRRPEKLEVIYTLEVDRKVSLTTLIQIGQVIELNAALLLGKDMKEVRSELLGESEGITLSEDIKGLDA